MYVPPAYIRVIKSKLESPVIVLLSGDFSLDFDLLLTRMIPPRRFYLVHSWKHNLHLVSLWFSQKRNYKMVIFFFALVAESSKTGLHAVEKRPTSWPLREGNPSFPGRPVHSPFTASELSRLTTDACRVWSKCRVLIMLKHAAHIVTDLINALPGNRSVNTNTLNNRGDTVFYAVRAERAHGSVGSLLPSNEAVNMHSQQWETVFFVGSVQMGYLRDERR
jgi:hypothetical protein